MRSRDQWRLVAAACVVAMVTAMTGFGSRPADAAQVQGLDRALAAQAAHGAALLQGDGVVGHGVGVGGGQATVVVFVERADAEVPARLGGVAVTRRVVGEVTAAHHRPGHSKGGPGPTTTTSTPPTTAPPTGTTVAIGDSTGNALECAAGTVGATVTIGGQPHLLSNNHVFARENAASIGEDIVSPGRLDAPVQCGSSTVVADLSDFEPISFSGPNVIDAAVAAVRPDATGVNVAPSYGAISTSVAAATVGLSVEKHGRTTGHTRGEVTAVNATINVGYDGGVAQFVGQIIVEARKPFLKSGDSGSLLVTRSGNQPVGLLFAGTSTGKLAVANPIGDVLAAFGATF